jgi:cytochrome c551/c552
MHKLFGIFLFLIGMAVSFHSYACDMNMNHWHGDMPGMGHGHEFYSCPQRGEVDQKSQAMPGAQLFQSKGCVLCHTIGGGDKTGPDLAGLFKRRDETWVREFIQDPARKIKTDAKASALQGKYETQMPQLELSRQELDQIVDFLKSATRQSPE